MVNLLARDRSEPPGFAALDPAERRRLAERLQTAVRLEASRAGAAGGALLSRLESMLAEIEEAPSFAGLESLLEELESGRREILASLARGPAVGADLPSASSRGKSPGGDWLCYRPGRSLQTAEPLVASHGFFDDFDRPPLRLWLIALARPLRGRAPSRFETAVLIWIPSEALHRARMGRDACRSGALIWLEEIAPDLAASLPPV